MKSKKEQNNLMIEPKVGVGIIIARNNQVLLVRRKNVHGSGSWSTPGGHLDFGETPEQTAAREAIEEVSLQLSDIHFRAVTNDVFEDLGKHYITFWMETNDFSGEPRIAAEYEIAEVGWFDWNKLPEPLFLPFRNLVQGKHYPKENATTQALNRVYASQPSHLDSALQRSQSSMLAKDQS